MGSRIALEIGRVEALADHVAIDHQHRTDRNLTGRFGTRGQLQRAAHEVRIAPSGPSVSVARRSAAGWHRRVRRRPPRLHAHSHSIVAGGLPEMSYTTRLMPRTSLMMRLETLDSRPYGSSAQWAVMKSSVCTARNATTCS